MENKIRSKYIQDLVNEKENLKKKMDEMTSESLKDIVGEEVNKNLRKLMTESDDDEDSYSEEEVDDPTQADDDATDDNMSTDTDDADSDADAGDTDAADTDTADDTEADGDEADDDADVWDSLEQYKDADGEFDLRGMDNDSVVKVLKLISKDDANGVRVYKNPTDDTLVLSDDDSDKQYVIDLGDGDEADEADVDVTEESCGSKDADINEDLGYTDNYQGGDAMTNSSNNEPADPKTTYSMDDGVPTGTEKPYGKAGDRMEPFDSKVNEEDEGDDFEIEIADDDNGDDNVEEATNVGGFAAQNSTAKSHVPNSDGRFARNQSKGGEYSGTTKPRYTNESVMKIMKKANTIFNDNKQLKNIVSELRDKINEAIVINYNMGRVIKLLTENSTSKEEKLGIIKRFDNVRTLQESKDVYTKVDAELKDPNRIAKINNVISKQLAEAKTTEKTPLSETTLYQSDDLRETLSFMSRLDAVE